MNYCFFSFFSPPPEGFFGCAWEGSAVPAGLLADAGILTNRGICTPPPVYSVENPEPLSLSQNGLGRAFKGRRDQVVIATKFGFRFEGGKRVGEERASRPEHIRKAVEGSLHRLYRSPLSTPY
jgi:hypothetical protein